MPSSPRPQRALSARLSRLSRSANPTVRKPIATALGRRNVASLPVREELALGGYLTSLAGYGLTYNTLDNNKRPTSGSC